MRAVFSCLLLTLLSGDLAYTLNNAVANLGFDLEHAVEKLPLLRPNGDSLTWQDSRTRSHANNHRQG